MKGEGRLYFIKRLLGGGNLNGCLVALNGSALGAELLGGRRNSVLLGGLLRCAWGGGLTKTACAIGLGRTCSGGGTLLVDNSTAGSCSGIIRNGIGVGSWRSSFLGSGLRGLSLNGSGVGDNVAGRSD